MDIVRHFTATGIVINGGGEVLMIRHRKLGVWLPPGGHVEPNETPDAAVVREVFEETGIHARICEGESMGIKDSHCAQLATPLCVLLEDIEGDGRHMHIDLVYLLEAENSDLCSDNAETTGAGWFSLKEALELDTFENVRKTIVLAFERWEKGE